MNPGPEPVGREERKLEDGIGLCLSGGGFRAMLFHVGTLWRLNELGLLPRIDRFSSVSGGSIASGFLALKWPVLGFDPGSGVAAYFEKVFVAGIRRLASATIDVPAVLSGTFSLRRGVGEVIASYYDQVLFQGATLQDLPDRPRFFINASNLQTGGLWRFSKRYLAGYQVALWPRPDTSLALAVAASAGFPPFLSPVRLNVDPDKADVASRGPLFKEPYNTRLVLTDGGVYDNLGLEPVFKRYRTVLVSDGGAPMQSVPYPSGLWPLQLLRVIGTMQTQVEARRKLELIDRFQMRARAAEFGLDEQSPVLREFGRSGAFWGIATDPGKFSDNPLAVTRDAVSGLARIPTRLKALCPTAQEQLINWGYAVCDLSLRQHFRSVVNDLVALPYPSASQCRKFEG